MTVRELIQALLLTQILMMRFISKIKKLMKKFIFVRRRTETARKPYIFILLDKIVDFFVRDYNFYARVYN